MSNTTSLFKGLREAKTYEKGIWLKEGQYEIRVKRALYKKTRKSGDAFILEFVIEKSNYESAKKKAIETLAAGGHQYTLQELEKLLPNQAGTTASWYQSLKDQDIGFGALKGFAASVLGEKPEDPAFIEAVEGFMDSVVNDDALKDAIIPVEVIVVPTKENKDFSRHNWGQMIDPSRANAPAAP